MSEASHKFDQGTIEPPDDIERVLGESLENGITSKNDRSCLLVETKSQFLLVVRVRHDSLNGSHSHSAPSSHVLVRCHKLESEFVADWQGASVGDVEIERDVFILVKSSHVPLVRLTNS